MHEQVVSNNLFVSDHSHFQLIIDQVKKAVAERKQISETDDLDILPEEQPEGLPPEVNVCLYPSLEFIDSHKNRISYTAICSLTHS